MVGVTNRKNLYSNSVNLIIFITLVIYLLLSFVPANTSFAQDGTSNTQADLAWAEFDGEDFEIYYGYFNGGVWSPKIQLSHNRSEDIFPSISSGADGVSWVVWSAFDGSNSMLVYSNSGENTWSVPQKISTHLTSNTAPSIAVDNSNTPWIVWAGNNGQDDEIYFTRWNGRSWDEPTQVNREDTTPDILPKIGIDANGNPFVIWSGYDGEKYIDYFSGWRKTEWGDESIAVEQMYRSLTEDSGRQIPELPEYLTDPDSASIHIRGTSRIQSIRLYDTNKPPSESLENYSEVEWENQPEGVNVAFIALGDSITQGYPDIDEPGRGRRIGGYEPHLETLLKKGPSQTTTVLNFGIAGEPTSDGLNRIGEILARVKSNFILILEGTNDLFRGISRSTTYANLRAMIDKSRARNVTPILATLTPDTRPGPNVFKDIKGTYNPNIKKIAAQKKVMLADLYNAVHDRWYALSEDELHPNDAGYRVIAEKWFNTIKSEIPKVVTWGAIAVDDTEATVSGFINPNNFPTRYYFEYGWDSTYGGLTTEMNAGSGKKLISVSADLSDLSDEQVYHLRLVAYNDFVKHFGKNQSFETLKTPDTKPCFIATAAFGSPLEPGVLLLKAFRDKYLLKFGWGRAFVGFYYRNSHQLADIVAKNKFVKMIVRAGLYPLVGFSYLMLNSSAGVKIIFLSLFVFVFIGLAIPVFRYRLKTNWFWLINNFTS